MLTAALEAEVDAYLAELASERDERGRRLVVRNGQAQPRQVLTAAGAVEVRAPRVSDKRTDPGTGARRRFRSVILPPWCRKSPKVAEVWPLLYFGSRAAGLAMAFKLIEAAQDRWRAVNAPHLVALVRAGATFVEGHLVERPTDITAA